MTVDLTPTYTQAVLDLMKMDDEMVYAHHLSPIVKMHASVIIHDAKAGKWPREVCNYIISGDHVKFFRIDFLRKGGWIA